MQSTMKRILLVVLGAGACLAGLLATGVMDAMRPLAMHEPQAVSMVRHNLTLAQWAHNEPVEAVAVNSSLRATSNHFVIGSVQPEGETVKPGQALA